MHLPRVMGFGLAMVLGGCGAAGGDGDAAGEPSGAAETGAGSQVPGAPEAFSSNAELSAASAHNERTAKLGLLMGPGVELLATVDLLEGGQVNFIRDPEGVLTVSQIHRTTAAAPISADEARQLGPVEVFRRVAPERAVPDALTKAELALPRSRPAVPQLETEGEAASELTSGTQDDFVALHAPIEGQLQQAAVNDSKCPADRFEEEQCGTSSICRLHKTGDGKVARSDADFLFASACSYRGKIGHRLDIRHWWDWKIHKDVILNPGWVEEVYVYGGGEFTDFDFEAIINRASGDGWNQAVFPVFY